jgi:hypothetical protein
LPSGAAETRESFTCVEQTEMEVRLENSGTESTSG